MHEYNSRFCIRRLFPESSTEILHLLRYSKLTQLTQETAKPFVDNCSDKCITFWWAYSRGKLAYAGTNQTVEYTTWISGCNGPVTGMKRPVDFWLCR